MKSSQLAISEIAFAESHAHSYHNASQDQIDLTSDVEESKGKVGRIKKVSSEQNLAVQNA